MDRERAQPRHKHFRWGSAKLSLARKVLRADTVTETIERAVDFVLCEHRRNQLAWEVNERFLTSGIEIKDIYGGLGTAIASRLKEVGLVTDLRKVRGHKIGRLITAAENGTASPPPSCKSRFYGTVESSDG